MSDLTQVDKLDFLVLVDNCIEWISTLPPGFSHEVPQHILRPPPHSAPIDPMTGLPILDLDHFCCGAHGLAIHISTEIGGKRYNVLMDGGPESRSIERNVEAMSVPLSDLDAIVLSHWHRDHSGGLVKALEMRQRQAESPLSPLTVDLHPDRPLRRGIARPPKNIPTVALPPDPTFAELEAQGGRIDLRVDYHDIIGRDGSSTGVRVSGEIPRVIPFEVGLPGAVTWMKDENGEEGWFTDEQIKDERYVVVDVKGKGLVIFSSCSHAGICNVITDAIRKYDRPVHMIVGGFHLVPVEQQPVDQTVDFIARRLQPSPRYVLPLHCTGLEPRARLKAALNEACIPAGVGMRVTVDSLSGKEQGEEMEVAVLE